MLIPIIGGVIGGVIGALSVLALCHESLTVPPKDLTRRWHRETAPRGRR